MACLGRCPLWDSSHHAMLRLLITLLRRGNRPDGRSHFVVRTNNAETYPALGLCVWSLFRSPLGTRGRCCVGEFSRGLLIELACASNPCCRLEAGGRASLSAFFFLMD